MLYTLGLHQPAEALLLIIRCYTSYPTAPRLVFHESGTGSRGTGGESHLQYRTAHGRYALHPHGRRQQDNRRVPSAAEDRAVSGWIRNGAACTPARTAVDPGYGGRQKSTVRRVCSEGRPTLAAICGLAACSARYSSVSTQRTLLRYLYLRSPV